MVIQRFAFCGLKSCHSFEVTVMILGRVKVNMSMDNRVFVISTGLKRTLILHVHLFLLGTNTTLGSTLVLQNHRTHERTFPHLDNFFLVLE